MNVCGIVAEYNPFHSGHRYHIRKTREAGATHIAVAMSTSFVQRGEPAAFDLFLRARSALENGADLVAALPVVYSMSGAGVFCRSGIETLSLLGCDSFSFGCETPEEELLMLKQNCQTALQSDIFRSYLENGVHFAKARAQTVKELFGDASALDDANTALALGYLEANDGSQHPMSPIVIKREGVSHDALLPGNGFASASYLRKSPEEWEFYLPESKQYQAALQEGRMTDHELSDRLLTAMLKGKSISDWEQTAGVSEGLWNRLYDAAKSAMTAEEMLSVCKSKRYPMASLRRMLWSCALGITDELQQSPIPGIWIIGANKRGYEILSRSRKFRKENGICIPVTPKFADFANACPKLAEIEQYAADIRSLCSQNIIRTDLFRNRIETTDMG